MLTNSFYLPELTYATVKNFTQSLVSSNTPKLCITDQQRGTFSGYYILVDPPTLAALQKITVDAYSAFIPKDGYAPDVPRWDPYEVGCIHELRVLLTTSSQQCGEDTHYVKVVTNSKDVDKEVL